MQSNEAEFTPEELERPLELDRRAMLKWAAATAALAGGGVSCRSPEEKILPYVRRPLGVTPGIPLHYATSFVLDGFATGVIARSHEGRPTKIEGNPEHPASLGATGVFEQASVIDLYDPQRLRAPKRGKLGITWGRMLAEAAAAPALGGTGPWFVGYPESSPVFGDLMARVRERHPRARFSFTSPLARRSTYQATRAVFGRPLEPQWRLERARVLLTLDADFTDGAPMSARWARDFARGRRLAGERAAMSRFYAIEAAATPLGSLADHRLVLRSGQVPEFAATLLAEVLGQGSPVPLTPRDLFATLPPPERSPYADFVRVLARDLREARGESLVIAGDGQPPETHVLAMALNRALDNLGHTLSFTEPALLEPEGGQPLSALAGAIDAGDVETVVVLEGNPAYTAPRELELGKKLGRVPNSVHLTYRENSTSKVCRTVFPASHFLESWGDARAYDGTISFVQPLIEPLVPSRSSIELLAAFAGILEPRGHRLLTALWRARLGADFDAGWDTLLKDGFQRDSGHREVAELPKFDAAAELVRRAAAPALRRDFELRLGRSHSLYDGRFAGNQWLLELPDPVTKQSWGNAAILAPHTASIHGVVTGDELELELDGRRVRAPALLSEGHAEHSISLAIGYGEDGSEDGGANAFALGSPEAQTSQQGLRVTRTGQRAELAITQKFRDPGERALAPVADVEAYRRNPNFTAELRGPQVTLLPQHSKNGLQWAMTIDTMICTGCSSCVIACQAENNVPVVGKRDALRAREMYWLRIDTYRVRDGKRTRTVHQPMLCQHCENAPCEYVCPVNATVHSPDGLNEMVYNRCIGTRFCSNNCPYKVRRFNWFDYGEGKGRAALQRNPQVTVRERGVMEKCTFCVQRIRTAEHAARVEGRALREGEVVTACQQACPTGAIQFGSLSDKTTPMITWRREPRRYAVLHDLGTRPRILYLADIRNPHPELEA